MSKILAGAPHDASFRSQQLTHRQRYGPIQESAKLARDQAPSWTQTGVSSGMMPVSQIQSIAGTLTRTQPCEAG
jgi:hypothetical protein